MRHTLSVLFYIPALLLPICALAQDFRVNVVADEADGVCDRHCSLRDAVTTHNRIGGSNRIVLLDATDAIALSLPPPYGDAGEVFDEDQNANGDFDILTGDLTLIGAGRDISIIEGNRVDRLFEVMQGASLAIRNITLRGGQTSEDGGAIENHGRLTIHGSRLLKNSSRYLWGRKRTGGGISSSGELEIYDSSFEDNSAISGSGGAFGGAVFNLGTMQVAETVFRNNGASSDGATGIGGAIFNIGTGNIRRSSFVGNKGNGQGTAIRNDGDGLLTLANITVTSHSRSSHETFAVVANGSGYPMYAGSPTMKLVHATIATNWSLIGLYNQGKLTIRNSLLAGNELGNCVHVGQSLQVKGLLLGLDSSNCPADIYVGGNLYGVVIYGTNSAQSFPIIPLPPSSPALDAGVGPCLLADQRGYPRPQDGDGDGVASCDIGAYERGPRR